MLQEMLFVFPAKIQSGIASGAYEVVKNSAGVALGIARDKATGQFVGHAILIMAYGQFLEATKLMKIAMKIEDVSARNVNLSNAQLHLSNALNAYHQNDLFHQTCAAGQLRRYEIIWMMEQAQAFNYLLLNAPEAASHCLGELQEQVTNRSLGIIDHCQSEAELDFIYPEMAKIHTQDLPLLKAWQHQIDWSKQLSPSDKQELAMLMQQDTETVVLSNENMDLSKPPEMILYQELKSKSHYQSLRDQLKFIVNPQLRQGYQHYIKEQAIANEQKGIASANLESITDLTIANLFHYLKETELVV